MAIELRYTAVGSGYYKVEKNGVFDPPNHTSEREAVEHASNLELANPADDISYYHDYKVIVEAVTVPDPDTTAPTVTITVSDVDLLAGETATVTFSFSEPVINFDATDVTVENGTLGPLSTADGGVTWTATFTPAPDLLDTTNMISVAPTYEDAAGNVGSTGVSPNIAINTVVAPPPDPSNPLDALQPGEWFKYPNSLMSSVDPCPGKNCLYSGVEGQPAVMTNWSSGIYDWVNDQLIVWGGGHSGYGGNEVYAFGPVSNPAIAKWKRLSEPSVPAYDVELYPDGTPSSRHNYGTLQFDPVGVRMFALSGGSTFSQVTHPSRSCHSFDLTSKTWRTGWPGWEVGDNHNTASDWDAKRLGFWVKNSFSTQFGLFRPEGNGGLGSWGANGPSWYSSPYMTLAIDSKRDKMLGIGGNPTNNKRLNVFNLATGGARSNPVSTGDVLGRALEVAQAPGFFYDPVGDRFIGWNGGRNVFQLNPDTFEWLMLKNYEGTQENPGAAQAAGTYGRCRYVPAKHGMVVVNRTTGSVYFYKLTSQTVAAVPAATVNGTTQSLQSATNVGGPISISSGLLTTGATVPVAGTSIVGAGMGLTKIIGGSVSEKGQLVVSADASIASLTLEKADVSANNGAGIRHDSGKLTATEVKFLQGENGYLGTADADFLRCIFDGNGYGDGYTHGLYSGATSGGVTANLVTVTDGQFRGTKVGHHLKSRAKKTVINGAVMEAATESYSCDFPWGGEVEINGLSAAQGAGTGNAVLINYGSETNATPHPVHSFAINNSVLGSTGVAGAVAIRIDAKTPVIVYATNVDFNGFNSKVTGGGVLKVVYTNCRENGVAIPDTV